MQKHLRCERAQREIAMAVMGLFFLFRRALTEGPLRRKGQGCCLKKAIYVAIRVKVLSIGVKLCGHLQMRLVEHSGIEPLTSCMPCRRSPS